MDARTFRRRLAMLRPVAWRAAWWAWRALRQVVSDLPEHGVRTRVPPPPAHLTGGEIGVRLVMRTVSPTCLERSLVLQSWLAARGYGVDIIIGVPRDPSRSLSKSNSAHAWLATETTQTLARDYTELSRISAGQPATGR